MLPFVLKTTTTPWGSSGYFTGKVYLHQGEYFANTEDIKYAKLYSSNKRAENAKDALNNKVANYTFEVVELDNKS